MKDVKKGHSDVNFIREGHYRILSKNNFPIEQFIRLIRKGGITAFLGCATPLSSRGSGSQSFRIELSGQEYFLKQYFYAGLRLKIKNMFRSSKAQRVWNISHFFLNNGVSVARPVFLLEERKYGVLKQSCFITEYYSGYRSIKEIWGVSNRKVQDGILHMAAKELANLHCLGGIHGDTNWRNILISDREGDRQIVLVDLDCSKVRAHLTYQRAVKDLDHFIRDLHRDHVWHKDQIEIFTSTWKSILNNND